MKRMFISVSAMIVLFISLNIVDIVYSQSAVHLKTKDSFTIKTWDKEENDVIHIIKLNNQGKIILLDKDEQLISNDELPRSLTSSLAFINNGRSISSLILTRNGLVAKVKGGDNLLLGFGPAGKKGTDLSIVAAAININNKCTAHISPQGILISFQAENSFIITDFDKDGNKVYNTIKVNNQGEIVILDKEGQQIPNNGLPEDLASNNLGYINDQGTISKLVLTPNGLGARVNGGDFILLRFRDEK